MIQETLREEEEFIIESNDNEKQPFKFKFKVLDDNMLMITAREASKTSLYPKTYEDSFSKEELSASSVTKITFSDVQSVLGHITSSFLSKKSSFTIQESSITLTYFIFNSVKVQIKIPLLKNENQIFSLLNRVNSSINNYERIIKSISNKLMKTQSFTRSILREKNDVLFGGINFLRDSLSDVITQNFDIIKSYFNNSIGLQQNKGSEQPSKEITAKGHSNNSQQIPKENQINKSYPMICLFLNPIEDLRKSKIIDTVKTQHIGGINSICILKDKRLASCSSDKSIIIYNSNRDNLHLKEAHSQPIFSLCVLKNGDLVSSSNDIKIWKINEDVCELIHTLSGHDDKVYKIIELKDGKMCSCSRDNTIKIWSNDNYECIHTLGEHSDWVRSILEMDNYIISASVNPDDGLRLWNKTTLSNVKNIKSVYCASLNGLSKLNDNVVLVGGKNKIFIVDILSFKVVQVTNETLKDVNCFHVLNNGKVLFGCNSGEICCFDSLSNQITLKYKSHKEGITCLIENENHKIISSSIDKTINIYN